MEYSPLRFLDYDVSLILSEKVRLSIEEKARAFHYYNHLNLHKIDLNLDNHYFILMIFKNIGHLLESIPIEEDIVSLIPTKNNKRSSLEVYNCLKMPVNVFKFYYIDYVKDHIKKTRLQRCGYNYY